MRNNFGIFLAVVLVMGILSYPAPITNSQSDNLSNLDVGLVGFAFAEDEEFEDEHEEFDEREFEDEHEEFDEKEFEDEHEEFDENEKVKLCHFPEGQDDNPVTIEIDRSAVRSHLNHGDFFGGCEQFGSPEHDKEKEDRPPHDVPDDLKEQIGIVLEEFTPEELEEIMEEVGPRETASIIAEHTELSFREAQKLVNFVMKEMADEQDREHDKEKEHDGDYDEEKEYDEDHEFPEHLEENARIVMESFSEEEIMTLMEIGPEAMINAIVDHTDLTEEEAKEIVKYAMEMERPQDREGRDEIPDHEIDEEEDDFIGGIMKGEYPTDNYIDSLLGGITSGGESIGGLFGGESDEVTDEPEFEEAGDDMFEGLFGIFGGEDEEMKDDLDDDVTEFEDDFDEPPRDVISHEAEEKLNELENRLAERDMELEQAQNTIVELEDRLAELEKRFDLIMELLANQ